MSDKKTISRWTKKAESVLLNRKIVTVRYASDKEVESAGHYRKGLILHLDDGTILWPTSDDEGNDAGAIHYEKAGDEETILPVI